MMTEKLERILTLLAAAQVSPSEFRTIVMDLQGTDPSIIEQRYARVRAKVRRISETASTDDASPASANLSKRVRDDVLSFARDGAASPGEAAERLGKRLAFIDDTLQLPPFSSKVGFNRWLEKVIRIASPNAVLNAAIAEFSEHRPSHTDGWRLSDS
ncbi:hypothetical protein EH240_30790 [Mesorhizobium tamadayense]|uniref:Uncharacterized protein n=1 Tax=Mesorhizobium tamadayense TaxID=425306 RepID=A0A3P3F2U7_9HYPH|nr:hypothetical protein [Mesorhizobium tamadayense]RRH92931.1 hypothetical protein EH240_30790 [Mesorhizobium tamadayense]